VTLETEVVQFLSDPTYSIPLVLGVVLAGGVGYWSFRRTAAPPPMVPRAGHEWWNRRPETVAYVALSQGRYFLALSALWLRLSTVVQDRLGVELDDPHALDRASLSTELPEPLTLKRLVRDMARAYQVAYLAERPSWLEERSAWLRRRQERRAAREFARAVNELALALPVLEGVS